MSDPENREENFLQRWSRRKQMADAGPRERIRDEAPEIADADKAPSHDTADRGKSGLPAFDPATLPPIDSITATSDIRAFLAPGVPEELARAALRRAWVMDPAIRDFVGLAENQWDFTKPDSVPGFGSLELTPELRRMLERLVGEPAEHPSADGERAKPIAEASDTLAARTAPPPGGPANTALQPADPPLAPECGEKLIEPGRSHRRHGGALPK